MIGPTRSHHRAATLASLVGVLIAVDVTMAEPAFDDEFEGRTASPGAGEDGRRMGHGRHCGDMGATSVESAKREFLAVLEAAAFTAIMKGSPGAEMTARQEQSITNILSKPRRCQSVGPEVDASVSEAVIPRAGQGYLDPATRLAH